MYIYQTPDNLTNRLVLWYGNNSIVTMTENLLHGVVVVVVEDGCWMECW